MENNWWDLNTQNMHPSPTFKAKKKKKNNMNIQYPCGIIQRDSYIRMYIYVLQSIQVISTVQSLFWNLQACLHKKIFHKFHEHIDYKRVWDSM